MDRPLLDGRNTKETKTGNDIRSLIVGLDCRAGAPTILEEHRCQEGLLEALHGVHLQMLSPSLGSLGVIVSNAHLALVLPLVCELDAFDGTLEMLVHA